jgi:hypothetical protein
MDSCQCYRIDHPGAEQDCPKHGASAVAESDQQKAERQDLLLRIAELEAEVAQLRASKVPERVKRVYDNFNPLAEEDRLVRALHSEGLEAAIEIAKKLKKIYLNASLSTRVKYHTRSYPYRFSYIESVYSIRYILRTKFLESIDRVVE